MAEPLTVQVGTNHANYTFGCEHTLILQIYFHNPVIFLCCRQYWCKNYVDYVDLE